MRVTECTGSYARLKVQMHVFYQALLGVSR